MKVTKTDLVKELEMHKYSDFPIFVSFEKYT